DQSTVIAYRQLIVEGLYDQMLNARFFELTQKPDAPILAGFAGQGSFVRSMNVYQLGALVNETGIEQGLEALLIEGERVVRHGFTLGELDRAKAEALRGMEQAFAERANRDHRSYADEYVRHTLQGEPIPGIEIEYQLYQGLLPTIELTDVDRMASEWIVDENRVVMVSAPQKEGLTLPSEQVLGMAFSTVMALEIAPYEDTAIDAPLLATIPTGSAVTTTERLEEVDVTVWALENGVRVLLKPTDFKDDEILFRAYSPGGSSLLSDDDFATMFAAAQVVAQGGVGEFSVIDLQKQLAGKAVNVNPNIGDLNEGISGQASPKDIEAMFQLIYLYFTAPRKDPGVFQAFQAQMQGILANRSASPQAAFADTMQVTMAQGHPRATPISAERVAELDLDRSYEFYQDRFADASDFTFVFVGTFTLEQMQPLVETYLGGLPSIGREETWRDTGVRPPKGVITKAVRKGVEPQSQTTMIFTGPFDYIAENRHSVRSLTAAFQMRMDERLREDLGGTYSPSVTSSYSKDPEWSYTIRVSFGSAPDRVEELTNVVVQEIAKFTNEGPTEEEVTGVREAQRRAKETNLKNNRFWLTNLYAADMYGQDPVYLLDYSLLEGLTITKIQAAAAQYFDMQNYVVVSLFPQEQVP
ncbi:MAG: insulinase family protein, partial [Gemmatimonadales bacterium]